MLSSRQFPNLLCWSYVIILTLGCCKLLFTDVDQKNISCLQCRWKFSHSVFLSEYVCPIRHDILLLLSHSLKIEDIQKTLQEKLIKYLDNFIIIFVVCIIHGGRIFRKKLACCKLRIAWKSNDKDTNRQSLSNEPKLNSATAIRWKSRSAK